MQLPFQIDLRDRVVVITGAGGVLCGMFARAVAAAGARTALLDLNLEAARAVEREIVNEGGVARAYACNVLERGGIEAVHDAVVRDLGPCDALINGAGGNSPRATTDDEFFSPDDLGKMKTFFDLDARDVEFVFNLNFLGTLLPTQVFARDMIGRGGGQIINVSSMNAFTPLTKIPAYSGAKAAVSNLTQWLAVHFSKQNIRCNALAPGFFATNQNAALLFDENGAPTKRTEKILRSTPMGRFGRTEELLGALLFLLCEEASGFITGVVIPVDGGFSAYSGV